MTRVRVYKLVLSLFVIYHVSAVTILPNGGSIVGRKLARYFIDYGNLLVFNRTWQFFSPSVAPNFYLRYEVETEANALSTDRPVFQYPEINVNRPLNDLYIRSISEMRFLAMDPDKFAKYFVPFLCRKHPLAVALDIRSVFEDVPHIERAGEYADFKEMMERSHLPSQRYECIAKVEAKTDATENDQK